MPTVKNKAVPSKGGASPKSKKSFHGHVFGTTGGKSGIGFVFSAAKLEDGIDKLTAQFGEQLKRELAKSDPENCHRVFDFSVIINGGNIRVRTPKISGAAVKAVAGVVAPKFDPYDAGRKAVAQMQEAEGGAWTGGELGKLFGLTPANLHKRRSEHRIVWWRDAKNQFHYPKWQFNHAGALLPGVQDVAQAFRSSDEWRVMRYFLGPRGQLADRTPLDLLRAGEVKKVVTHAKVHAEENTW